MMPEAQFFAGLTGTPNDLVLAVMTARANGRAWCPGGEPSVNHHVKSMVTPCADYPHTAAMRAPGMKRILPLVGGNHPEAFVMVPPGHLS